MEQKKLTTASGRPYVELENSMTIGERGPILLQDYLLHEDMAHFNRERIPERVVHAKGTGAFGTFTVTHDITPYTKAKIFSKIGQQTMMFARFSQVGGEKGSADTERDPRGFALKFYTEDGNWDLVGNNTPVFFIKDPKKFSHFIHTQKRDPKTNCKSPTMMWDFWSLNPESLHQVLILMSDRGTPSSFRNMHGFGSHTYSMINKNDERVWVKFHLLSQQGIKNFTGEEANAMKAKDLDYLQRDMVEAIERKDFPKWTMHIQVMTDEQAKQFPFNPFDITKVWSHKDFPLIEVGEMELNKIPENYFRDVEQAAFAPANIVNGIGFSPDRLLQGRILSYPDAHRYRLGVNYETIPVNKCPFAVNNYQRDGMMQMGDNGGASPNYSPNSFDEMIIDKEYKEPVLQLESTIANWFDRNENDDDHYTQPGNLYRLALNETDRVNLVNNIVSSMSGITGIRKEEIVNRQLCQFFRTDNQLGMEIATRLGVIIDDKMLTHNPHDMPLKNPAQNNAIQKKIQTTEKELQPALYEQSFDEHSLDNNSVQELNDKILKVTMTIKEKHPELVKYLNEVGASDPLEKKTEITLKSLKAYYDTLCQMLEKYQLELKVKNKL